MFLEDHISHKNTDVYRTPNKRAIEQTIYDILTEHTFEEPQHEEAAKTDSDSDFDLENYPDLSDMLNENYDKTTTPETSDECSELEILEGFEDIVLLNLVSNVKEDKIPFEQASHSSQVQITENQLPSEVPVQVTNANKFIGILYR